MKINELEVGQTGTFNFLLLAVEEKENYKGEPFVNMTLSDGENRITATRWQTKKDAVERYINKVIKVNVSAREYNGLRYNVESLELTKEPVQDYIISAPIEANVMFDEIIEIIKKRQETSLSDLAIGLLNENKEDLLSWAGAKEMHHAFYSGLLYHTYRMVKQADVMADIYDSLDAELLVCGTALHDIGKLRELNSNALGAANYNIVGNMLGHIIIGIGMIDEYIFKNGQVEKVMEIKHLIASHHGEGEFGSPVVPRCPEAMVLHFIDMIDSRVEMAEENYPLLEVGEMTEKKVRGIDRLYRTK